MSFTALFSPLILLYMGCNAQAVKNLRLDISQAIDLQGKPLMSEISAKIYCRKHTQIAYY